MSEKIKRVQYSTSLDPEIIKKVKLQAIEEGKRDNDLIEEALNEYFNRKKPN